MNPKEQILNLRETLNIHNHNYYVLDKPSISDYDFDIKLKQLQDLENQNPYILVVNPYHNNLYY